jgi:hypothetical protein
VRLDMAEYVVIAIAISIREVHGSNIGQVASF